jgi:hypothetical protein
MGTLLSFTVPLPLVAVNQTRRRRSSGGAPARGFSGHSGLPLPPEALSRLKIAIEADSFHCGAREIPPLGLQYRGYVIGDRKRDLHPNLPDLQPAGAG